MAYVTIGAIGSQISFASGTVDPALFPTTGYYGTLPDGHTLVRSFTPASTGTHLITIKNHKLKAVQIAAWEATNIKTLVYKGSKAGSTDVVQASVELTAAQKYMLSLDTQNSLMQTMLRVEYAPAPLTQTCVAPVWVAHAPITSGVVRLSNPPPGVQFFWRVSFSGNQWILWDGNERYITPGNTVEAIGVGEGVCEGTVVTAVV